MSRRWLLAVVGILAVGAAAAAGAFFLWPSEDAATTCAGPVHAPVPAAAEEALAAFNGRIKHTSEGSASAPTKETWSDPTDGNTRNVEYDAAGKVAREFAQARFGSSVLYTWILYKDRIWVSDTAPGSPLVAMDTAVLEAQAYRDKAANGTVTVVGREVVGGRQTLHLREQLTTARLDTWVEALTYVPVQTRTGQPGHQTETRTTWLPRTPANVEKTTLAIPNGFRRVPMSLGPGSGTADPFALAAPGPGCAQS